MSQTARPDLQRFLNRLTSRSLLSEDEQQAVLDLRGHAEQVQANRDCPQWVESAPEPLVSEWA